MENKINIAEILKDKPQGTKLYSSACGKCNLVSVDDKSFKISFYNSKFGFMNGGEGYLDKNGKLYDDGECVVFPSKEMRDWRKFSWKKGDVLVSNDGGTEVIFDKWYDNTYTNFYCKHYLDSEDENNIKYYEAFLCTTERYSLEDKDAVQTYINTIEKRLGGKLNLETLEVENAQPEFKDGDIVYADYGHKQAVFIVSGKTDLSEGYNSLIALDLRGLTLDVGYMSFFKEDLCKLRFATEEEKRQLFSALAKENKAWDAEKKQIVELKPKVLLKPFDKVLCRDDNDTPWKVGLFSHIDGKMFQCVGSIYRQCIPYEGNEHLLGTTKDVED